MHTRLGWAGLVVAVALVATACSQSTAPSTSKKTIYLGSGTTEVESYMVPMLTAGRKMLADQGIKLETVQLSTDEAVEAALDQGRVDVALLSTQGLNRAVSAGLRMKWAVGLEQQNTFVLTTAADVTDLAQLRGKKIGNQDSTSLCISVISVMMEKAGLSRQDYQMVDVPGSTNRAAAMERGSLDAACLFRNVADQLAHRSGGRFKIFGGLYDVLKPMSWEGFAMSDSFRENKKLAEAFTRVVIETGKQFYQGDPAQMAARKKEIPQAETLDEGSLTGDFKQFQQIKLFPTDGGVGQQQYDAMVQFLIDQKQLDPGQRVEYSKAVDPSFVQAVTSGG